MENIQKKKFKKNKFAALYSQAEQVLKTSDPQNNDSLEIDKNRLLHELQVYHIELEMQNEELQATQFRLEEINHKYQTLYDFAPVGYFSISEEGIILDVNFTGSELLGLEKKLLLKQKFYNFISNDVKDNFHIYLRRIIKANSLKQSCELKMIKVNNQEFYAKLESQALRDEDGNFLYCMTTISDISQIKYYINELEKSKHEAEIARKEAEKANKFKSEFLASMSHEIRSPLSAILGFVAFLKKKYYHEYKVLFDNLELAASHLMETIRKIIDISRLETDSFPLKLEMCNISEIIESSLSSLKILAEQKGLTIIFENQAPDVYIYADLYVISHAILNIIDNAIKYTEKGSIEIKLFLMDKKIIIKVIDTGIGIYEEYLPNIFNKFSREKKSDLMNFEGVGLGMTLTKQFISLCNGNISVKSKKNTGSTFTIELPINNQS